jgi:hypothetical protein
METGLETEPAGEEAGPGVVAPAVLPPGQKRFYGDAQEVWCAGSDGDVRGGAWLMVMLSCLPGMLVFLILTSPNGPRWISRMQNGFEFMWWDFVLMGGLALLLLVGVAGLVWGLARALGRTLVRLEPGYITLLRRPLVMGTMVRFKASDVACVRVGVNAGDKFGQTHLLRRFVLLEMKDGERMSLVDSAQRDEVEALAWEVADYHGLACEMKPLAGAAVFGGGEFVAVSNGEADYTGVEVWDEGRVMTAGMKINGGRLVETDECLSVQPRALAREWALWMAGVPVAAITGLWLAVVGLTPGLVVVFVGLFMIVILPMLLMMLDSRCPSVRVSGEGVKAWSVERFMTFGLWRMRWGPELVARERVTEVRVSTAIATKGLQELELTGGRAGRTYALILELDGGRETRVLVRRVPGPAGHALGLARMMERRLGLRPAEEAEAPDEAVVAENAESLLRSEEEIRKRREVADEARRKEAEEEARARIDKQGRVRLSCAWWVRWVIQAVLVGVMGLVYHAAASGDPNTKRPDAMEPYLELIVGLAGGVLMFVTLLAVIDFPVWIWAEVSDGKLKVKKSGWLGDKTLFAAEAAEIARIWVHAQTRRERHGQTVRGGQVMMEMKGSGRSVELKGVDPQWGMWPRARAVSLLLALPEPELGVGTMVEGALIEQNSNGETLLDEALGERLAAEAAAVGRKEEVRHDVVREGDEWRVTRRRMALGFGCGLMLVCMALVPCVGVGLMAVGEEKSGKVVLAAGTLAVILVLVVMTEWLMGREWVTVRWEKERGGRSIKRGLSGAVDPREREKEVELRRLWLTGSVNRLVKARDVMEVVVVCESGKFAVGVRLREGVAFDVEDGAFVPLITEIKGVGEAMRLRREFKRALEDKENGDGR